MVLVIMICNVTKTMGAVSSNPASYEERCLRPSDFFNPKKGFWMISDGALESLTKKRGYSKIAEGPYVDPADGTIDYATTIKTYQLKSKSGKCNRISIHCSDFEEGHDIVFSDQDQLNTFLQKAEKMGFKKVASEYLLYNVLYTPIVNIKSNNIDKNQIDKIFFDYYKTNCGELGVKKNCKLIK